MQNIFTFTYPKDGRVINITQKLTLLNCDKKWLVEPLKEEFEEQEKSKA